jgi:hypothetical protein
VPLCGDSRPNRVITQHPHKPQASDRPLRKRTRTRRRSATSLSASTAPAELGDDIHTWLRFSGHCRQYLSATAACRSSTRGGRVASDERISQKNLRLPRAPSVFGLLLLGRPGIAATSMDSIHCWTMVAQNGLLACRFVGTWETIRSYTVPRSRRLGAEREAGIQDGWSRSRCGRITRVSRRPGR